MTNSTHSNPNAAWRSAASRLRSRLHSCSTVIGSAYGMKPATEVAIFGAHLPTRRGVPPQ